MLKGMLEKPLNPNSNKELFSLQSKSFLLAGQYCISLPSSGEKHLKKKTTVLKKKKNIKVLEDI